VHLDVKPGNVVLRDGRPVLIDLGLAGPVGEPPERGRVRGSAPWMAPEQVRRWPAAPAMDEAVDRLLAADPADRPAGAAGALALLAAALPPDAADDRPWPACSDPHLATRAPSPGRLRAAAEWLGGSAASSVAGCGPRPSG
jgi:eukaryotic-like serine/threonine-protein kinase